MIKEINYCVIEFINTYKVASIDKFTELKLFFVSSKGNIKTKDIKLNSFVVDTELSKLKNILP